MTQAVQAGISELQSSLANLIDTFIQSRDEYIRIHGTDVGFEEWCDSKIHEVCN